MCIYTYAGTSKMFTQFNLYDIPFNSIKRFTGIGKINVSFINFLRVSSFVQSWFKHEPA